MASTDAESIIQQGTTVSRGPPLDLHIIKALVLWQSTVAVLFRFTPGEDSQNSDAGVLMFHTGFRETVLYNFSKYFSHP